MTTLPPALDGVSFGMYDHFLPGVKAATYTLHVESQLKSSETGEVFHHETREMEFMVGAPRFSLVAQDEIRSCSPPNGGQADYRHILPHVVLERRALPWERPLDPNSPTTADNAIPWLALLLFTQDELAADGASIREMTIADMVRGPDDVFGPEIDVKPQEVAQTVKVLESSAKLFRAVCPRLEELPLLAHVRRVRMTEKLDASAPNERDFALLTANRLVQRGSNLVLLVSLEGWRGWLGNHQEPENARVQVIVLHSWSFTSNEGDGSFAAHVGKLDVGPIQDMSAMAATDDAILQAMFRDGYSAIAYAPDGAAKTIAWYRGPLAPVQDADFEASRAPFDSADSALIIDENTGMLDISLSSAFQLGRLLALSAASFGAALRHWNHTKQMDILARGSAESATMSLVEEMARYVASHMLNSEMSDPAFADVKMVTEWLMQARMLNGIPLRYLVPSANLLPPESLRLFYLDENWVDAFTDGALSLGASSSQTQWFHQANRGTLRQTLRTLMMASQKRFDANASAPNVDELPMCGILLRSSLFDRFPGIEIECADVNNPAQALPIVRRDMLDRGLLFVLVMGNPGQLRFKVPRESLTFSHDARGLRPRLTRTNERNQGARDPNRSPITIAEYLRQDSPPRGVLDVRKLHDKLEGPADKSSARFALHWLNGPDDVTIEWYHGASRGSS